MNLFSKIFGSNERELKKFQPILDIVNAKGEELRKLSDQELKNKTQEFRDRLNPSTGKGESLDVILPEAFAVVREAAERVIQERHYDVQILGGIALHKGLITEMKTGEGKTLTSTLPIYLNALTGKGVHVVTVNDYLAKRDCNWMGSIFNFLGISTACIIHDASFAYTPKVIDSDEVTVETENLKPITKQEAYQADITYGTNNEFGFDYLRDNMVQKLEQMTQRTLHYAIIDEADSILIDEARTPLIISAPDTESTKLYAEFARLVPKLKKEEDYQVDEKMRAVSLTESGIEKIERWLGIDNIYEAGKMNYVHHLEQALKAHVIFQRDKDYVVKDNEVIIVDDFTGRLMKGRRYSEGLHQAIEAKEGVRIQRESKTLATITFQNYFRMYDKLAGMTGTAITSAEEFSKVYELDVIEIPTHKPLIRKDKPDVIYKSEEGKFKAIVEKIKEVHKAGQPILVGTVAIEKSEYLSALLTRQGIEHEVLNAKNHEREALIISKAGQSGSVTIATNMAGRGTDIKLGEGVKELGGLYIIGSERHEARRIDNQLRGRSGRQGDPGASEFFISLEDELMRRFGGDKLFNMMDRLGLPEDQPIQNKIISRSIENAQSKIEGFNFDIRKHVWEYDDIMNKQREVIYKKRREILESENIKNAILENIQEEIEKMMAASLVGEEKSWDVPKIIAQIRSIFAPSSELESKLKIIKNNKKGDALSKIGEFNEAIFQEAKEAYNRKEQEMDENNMRLAERMIYLRTIDTNWMNHLSEMDYLRDSVGLRGYGQRDPLLEYKREAFNMFSHLLEGIRQTVVTTIFKIALVSKETQQEQKNLSFQGAKQAEQFESLKQMPQEQRQENSSQTDSSPQQSARNASHSDTGGPIINQKKVGRNDPCPCGSGKKYKKCCGK